MRWITRPLAILATSAVVTSGLALGALPQASADTGCPSAASGYASGAGTAGSPYVIAQPSELQRLRVTTSDWSKAFTLNASVDLTGCTWTSPLGTSTTKFSGVFDGNGYVISGLAISTTDQPRVGLFGVVSAPGIIEDLGFTGSVTHSLTAPIYSYTTQYNYVGGLVGFLENSATVRRSYSTASVSSTAVMTDAYSYSDSTYRLHVGGLVGSSEGSIADSWTTGSPTASATVNSPVSNHGVDGRAYVSVGGLVGANNSAQLTRSYSSGVPTGTATVTGFTREVEETNIGAAIGWSGGVVPSSAGDFYDTTTTSPLPAFGQNPSGTLAFSGKTSDELKAISTFSGASWDIVANWDPSKVWGICSSVNAGYPFLTAFYRSDPCVAPTVASLSHLSGSTAGGTSVTLTGGSLQGSSVTLGGQSATVTASTLTSLTFTTPAHAAGSADLVVTNLAGSTTSVGAFTYQSPPTVSSLDVDNGPSTGSTTVVITGSNLTTASAVVFGSTPATSFTVNSDTRITAVTPSGTPGAAVNVVVTGPGGPGTLTNGFTYDLLTQTVNWAPTTAITTAQSPLTPSVEATALGGATVTYAVRPGFTTAACSVDATTGVLTYSGTGSCTVRATAAATSTYAADTKDVTFTVTNPSSGGGGGGGGGGGSSSQTVVSTSLSTAANPAPQVSTLPPITPAPPAVTPRPNTGVSMIDGRETTTVVSENRGRVTVRIEGTSAGFSLAHGSGGGSRTLPGDVFRTGAPTGFTAQGFQPGTAVTIYAMSNPVLVATAIADGAGAIDGLITLPATLGHGAHTLVVSGYLSSGSALSSYLGITTRPSPTTISRRVFFPAGSARLSAQMKAHLAVLVRSVRGRVPSTVTVGVVREANATSADRALALQRARAVTAFLREKGMPGRVTIGASIPTTLTTWAARRADVTVTLP